MEFCQSSCVEDIKLKPKDETIHWNSIAINHTSLLANGNLQDHYSYLRITDVLLTISIDQTRSVLS